MPDEYLTFSVGGVTVQQLNHPLPPAQAVQVVTRRQALRALLEAGLLDDVDAAIEAMPEPQRSRAHIDWDNATEFRRDFPLLLELAAAMGLSFDQVDALFAAAAAVD